MRASIPPSLADIQQRLREAGGEFITSHDKTEAVIREAVGAGMSAGAISHASGLSPDTVRAFLRAQNGRIRS